MLRGYTCKRKTNRWPMVLFYNMVDIAALGAFRLFEICQPNWCANKSERRKFFLKQLAFELIKKNIENRCKNPLKSSVLTAMDLIGFKARQVSSASAAMPPIQVRPSIYCISIISISNLKKKTFKLNLLNCLLSCFASVTQTIPF